MDEFRVLFKTIAEKSIDESVVSLQNICDHFQEVGAIKVSDGSLQDCHKALLHYNKILVEGNFIAESGKFREDEFVRFWFNCHNFFNSYDLTNSGHLTQAEFITKCNELNQKDETEAIKSIFAEVDRDKDGEISFMEFFTKLPTIMGFFDD